MPGTNGATAADAGIVAAVTSPSTGWASGDAHHRSRIFGEPPDRNRLGPCCGAPSTLRQLHRHGTTPTAPR